MEFLVRALDVLNDSTLPNSPDHRLSELDYSGVYEIAILAKRLLRNPDGSRNFDEMDRLFREFGYFVFPGERGVAYIQTKKGFIAFD